MALKIIAEGCTFVTVTAAVAADLANKEGYIVQQVAAAETVELFTSGIPYAVLVERLQGGSQWKAALINGGGICPCIAGGAISAAATYVKAKSGGTVEAASSTNLSSGVKRIPAAAAASGDVVGVDLGLVTMP